MDLTKQAVDNICGLYREAKDKKKQISILAELNACTEADVCEVLKKQGYELPGGFPPAPDSSPGRKTYPPELRKAVVLDLAAGIRVADVAAKHGVPQKTVTQWKWLARKSGELNQIEKERHEKTVLDVSPEPEYCKPVTIQNAPYMRESHDVECEILLKQFTAAWDSLILLVPGDASAQNAVESYILRTEGFIAGLRFRGGPC